VGVEKGGMWAESDRMAAENSRREAVLEKNKIILFLGLDFIRLHQ
jgi:hypothetical protein